MTRCDVCHDACRRSPCLRCRRSGRAVDEDAPLPKARDSARVSAILDAIDLTVLEDGWIRFATWAERRRNAGPGAPGAQRKGRSLDASDESVRRAWHRLLARVRALGVGLQAGRTADGQLVDDSPGREPSVRFTPEGRATLRRLVAELDAWLLSTEVA